MSNDGNIKTASQSRVDVIADAFAGGWVYRIAPVQLRPWLQLMRLDRPVGVWLLLWPAFWSIALFEESWDSDTALLIMYFAVGAILMRGAGCIINDIYDRKLDARVERTANRPLASGRISVSAALVFLAIILSVSFLILLQFNQFTIILGVASLLPVAIYPLMKRITHWPQLVLGLTFNWGALLGCAAILGRIEPEAITLYAACMFWTLGYDTIYACQDTKDDVKVGIKSTALLFGEHVKHWVFTFYLFTWMLLMAAGIEMQLGLWFSCAMVWVAIHLVWQVWHLDPKDGGVALKIFKSNIGLGAVIFVGIALERLTYI